MKRTGDYYVIVVEDTNLGQIVATAMLIIEQKFIHSCAKVLDFSMEHLTICIISNDYMMVFKTQNSNLILILELISKY